MQNKIDVMARGDAVIFQKEALNFVLKWHEKISVHKTWIEFIAQVAGKPERIEMSDDTGNLFLRCYKEHPDFTAALLNYLRHQWSKLEKSKAGKLKKFLSQTLYVDWERGFGIPNKTTGIVTLWELQDGELAIAFEHSTNGHPVTIDDVVKARKWVNRNQTAYKKMAAKFYDKDDFCHAKGKLRRRK